MNQKIKALKLGVRNTVNRITGQQTQIKQYEQITHTLARASDKEKDPAKKRKILDALDRLTETVRKDDSSVGWSIDGFNQYKMFSNKKLSKKIEDGKKLIQKFGLSIVQNSK